jgi:hypothetical protein
VVMRLTLMGGLRLDEIYKLTQSKHDYLSRPCKRTQPGYDPVLDSVDNRDPVAARFADIVLLERRGLEITKHATGGNQQDTLARESRREFTGTEERRMLAPFAQERLCRDIGLSGDGGRGTGSQHQLDPQAQDRCGVTTFDDALHVHPEFQIRHDVRDSEDQSPTKQLKECTCKTLEANYRFKDVIQMPFQVTSTSDAGKWPAYWKMASGIFDTRTSRILVGVL